METILAGDIGGTNTRLALYNSDSLEDPLILKTYPSGDYESLWAIITRFFSHCEISGLGSSPARAGFGIAGPVDGSIVKLTNLPWVIDHDQLQQRMKVPVLNFVNDFYANCLAVPHLEPRHLHPVGGGTAIPRGPITVLGAGTGLGEGFVVWTGNDDYVVVPSEGGHKDFAPRNPLEARLLEYLTGKFQRVSYERVVSGQGLVNVYEFFRDRENMPESESVRQQMREEEAPIVITRNGMQRSCPISERALDLFCAVYGAEAGNLALQVLATGGVYLAGGIAKNILPRLEEGGFRHNFERKGRFTEFLRNVPTLAIIHPQPGLLGAALAALQN